MNVMPTSPHLSSGRQLDLPLEAGACKPSAKVLPNTRGADGRAAVDCPGRGAGARSHGRDRVTVDLRGLRARLNARAAQQEITAAALVRRAVMLMLDDGATCGPELAGIKPAAGKVMTLTLQMPSLHAAALASRARAADVSRGRYVCKLLDGIPAPPRPADHSATVTALRASTERVTAMSADLNAFLRLLRLGPNKQMENYRAGLMDLADDMRTHMATASALIADLAATRAKR